VKVLVTGATGFVGQHFVKHLGLANVIAMPETVDLVNFEQTRDFVVAQKFDAVLHLAALSSVSQSLESPGKTQDVNVEGTRHLLRSLQASKFSGRVLLVSSGEVYGTVEEANLPVKETANLAPRNPYAESKVAMEKLVLPGGEFADAGFTSLIARPFNHIGPGQAEHFVVASFVGQLARRKAGVESGPMKTGDLHVTRDFTDVRDIVSAYAKLLQMRAPISIGRLPTEIYNLGSGVETELKTILDLLIQISGTGTKVETDPARLRPNEQRRMCADISKVKALIDWAPHYELKETLQACFDERITP
jgi:GDP-4-dehydro-6-deoxy-D-mannose reductase